MIRITITPAAFAAIAATLALGTVAVEPERDEDGNVHIWLDPGILARLKALRGPGMWQCYLIVTRAWRVLWPNCCGPRAGRAANWPMWRAP